MNISAISMVNRMPSFAGKKQVVIHRNGGDDWYHEVVSEKPVKTDKPKKPSKPSTRVPGKVETEREYYERKLYSPEWVG